MKHSHYRFPFSNIIMISEHSHMPAYPDIHSMLGVRNSLPCIIIHICRPVAFHCEHHHIAYRGPRAVCAKCHYRKRIGIHRIRFRRLIVNHSHAPAFGSPIE